MKEKQQKIKKWYQVEIPEKKAFGFSVSDELRVIDHPDWEWRGEQLSAFKVFLLRNNAKVYFIAEQIYLV